MVGDDAVTPTYTIKNSLIKRVLFFVCKTVCKTHIKSCAKHLKWFIENYVYRNSLLWQGRIYPIISTLFCAYSLAQIIVILVQIGR